jgi:hypothetical protein
MPLVGIFREKEEANEMKLVIAALIVMLALVSGAMATNTLVQTNTANGVGQTAGETAGPAYSSQYERNCAAILGDSNTITQTNSQQFVGFGTHQISENAVVAVGTSNTVTQDNQAYAPQSATIIGADQPDSEANIAQTQENLLLVVGEHNDAHQTNYANAEESVATWNPTVSQDQNNNAVILGTYNSLTQSNNAEANSYPGLAEAVEGAASPFTQTQHNIAMMIGTGASFTVPDFDPVINDIDFEQPYVGFPLVTVPVCHDCVAADFNSKPDEAAGTTADNP